MKKPRLHLKRSRKIHNQDVGLDEPSGLGCEVASGNLWTVSDSQTRLFKLDPGGELLSSFYLPTSIGDFEGVVSLPEGKVAVLCERRSRIMVFDPAAHVVVAEGRLSEMSGTDELPKRFLSEDAGRNGLEGLTFNPLTDSFIAIAERDPRLMIEISADLQAVRSVQRLDPDSGIGHDDEDISGITWDGHRNLLWIVSDTGRRVFLYDPGTGRAKSRKLKRKGKSVKNAEGVAVSPNGKTLYVVTDAGKKSRLLAYRIRRPSLR